MFILIAAGFSLGGAKLRAIGPSSAMVSTRTCTPYFAELIYGPGISPYVEADTSGSLQPQTDGSVRLVLPDGNTLPVKRQGWRYAVVEVPLHHFQFGQSSFDTAAQRLPRMIENVPLLTKFVRQGFNYEATLRGDGTVSIADGHHRILAVAILNAYGRVGKPSLRPGEAGYEKAAAKWANSYLVPLMNISSLPSRDFARNSARLARRMEWLEKLLGDSPIEVKVPVWGGAVPLVTPSSSHYNLKNLLFNQDISLAQSPRDFPRTHPSVEVHDTSIAILDLLDRDLPMTGTTREMARVPELSAH